MFDRMRDALRTRARAAAGRRREPTAALSDSQSVQTTESGGPRGDEGGQKVMGRKRPSAVAGAGSPLGVDVHAASVQDRDGAPAVMRALLEVAVGVEKLCADSGYAGPQLQDAWHTLGEIVSKPKSTQGFTVWSRRWGV